MGERPKRTDTKVSAGLEGVVYAVETELPMRCPKRWISPNMAFKNPGSWYIIKTELESNYELSQYFYF